MSTETSQQDIARFAQVAEEVARATGAVAFGGFRGHLEIKSKGHKDIVTQYDTMAERDAIAIIQGHFPDHDILGEESGANPAGEGRALYRWAVDPIDGTHNYAAGLPFWCTAVAVMEAESSQVLAGAIYDPIHEELFTASLGGGAFLNGEKMAVSGITDLEDAFLATDIGYGPDIAQIMTSLSPWVQKHVKRFRVLGSAVLSMAYVAVGRFDGYYHLSLQPWDIAAVSLLLREAGAEVTDWGGKPLLPRKSGAIVSTPSIHSHLATMLQAGEARIKRGESL